MSILDWWRLLYAIVSAAIFVFVFIRLRRMLPFLEKRQLYWALAILGFILSSVISSLESIYFNDHLSIRTPLFMACCFWCVLGLMEERKKDEKERQRDDDQHGV